MISTMRVMLVLFVHFCAGLALMMGFSKGSETLPGADYQLQEPVAKLAHGVLIEKYAKLELAGQSSIAYYAWIHGRTSQLGTGQVDDSDWFLATSDGRWVIRTQKSCGCQDLYLYRKAFDEFTPVAKKSLSDQAWEYFDHLKGRDGTEEATLRCASIAPGADDNYAKELGVKWTKNRYLVITLTAQHGPVTDTFKCRYDLKTKRFDVPRELVK